MRAAGAVALVVAAGAAYDLLVLRGPPSKPCSRAMTAVQASRAQQGQPTTRDEALRQLDATIAATRAEMAGATKDAAAPAGSLAALELQRGQISGDYADFARAQDALGQAFAIAGPAVGPHLLRATFNMTMHRLDAVAPDLARVLAYKLPDPGETAGATAMQGDLLFYRGDYKRALPFYERAHGDDGGTGADVRLAIWWSKMGDPARAAHYLDEAACGISGPQQQLQAFVATQRGLLAMDRGRWDEAQAALERADAIFPGYWSIQFQLASIYGLRGDAPRALALLRRIAARDRSPEAYDAIAGLLRGRGDFAGSKVAADAAGDLWQARIALFPEAAYGHAVTHYLNFGDPRVALDLARRNYRARPYAPSATVLAAALIANRRPADALRAIQPALASGWTSADAQLIAAEAYALLGRGAEADAARRRALAINPHSLDRNEGLTWLEH